MRCLAIITDYETLETEYEGENFPPIDEWPHRWEKDTITYSVIRGTADLLGDSPERLALNLAMTTWDVEIKPHLKYVPITTEPNPDITVEFRNAKDDDLFSKRPGVLAYAYFPGQGSISGVIVFNDDYLWGLKQSSKKVTNPDGSISDVRVYNLVHTLIHEIGHALGLKHSWECDNCVMYPMYNNTIELHELDTMRIRMKYGARLFSNWFYYDRLKKWMARRKVRF